MTRHRSTGFVGSNEGAWRGASRSLHAAHDCSSILVGLEQSVSGCRDGMAKSEAALQGDAFCWLTSAIHRVFYRQIGAGDARGV
jgi:hypothetical protein